MDKLDCAAAAIAEFEYYPGNKKAGNSESLSVVIPESLLWSSRGVAFLFESVRASWLASPDKDGFDDDSWSSFHLTAIRQMPDNAMVLIGISSEDVLICENEPPAQGDISAAAPEAKS